MAVTQYIGSRYVPLFADPMEWSSAKEYEPLTIVLHEGNSFTSKQFVPVGVNIDNETYWVVTGNYNAQVEQYRRETAAAKIAADTAQADIDQLLPKSDFDATNTVRNYIDSSISNLDEVKPFSFSTVDEMKNSGDALFAGAICYTNGFHTVGDGGAACYIITSTGTENNKDIIKCGSMYANLVILDGAVSFDMLGAYGNGSNDDTDVINYAFNNYSMIEGTPNKNYYISSTVYIHPTNSFNGKNSTFVTNTSFAETIRYNQPSKIAIFIEGNGTSSLHKEIKNFNIRENAASTGLIAIYVGAANAYNQEVSTNAIAVKSRHFEHITVNGFEYGLYITESWDSAYDEIKISGSRNTCCGIFGQSVNNRFNSCGFYGNNVSSYALKFDFNAYYSLRNEGNAFSNCFIGESVTGIYITHTLCTNFNNCIVDLNSGHAIHDVGGAEISYTNCYIYSTLVTESVVNGGTIFLAAISAKEATIHSNFIGCQIINSSENAQAVIIGNNRMADTFTNCYINKPIRSIQANTRTVVVGCKFIDATGIYAYSSDKYLTYGNVNASTGEVLFDNGFYNLKALSGEATVTTDASGRISFLHNANMNFYTMLCNITGNLNYGIISTNNSRTYSRLTVFNTSDFSPVANTEISFNYVIIGH